MKVESTPGRSPGEPAPDQLRFHDLGPLVVERGETAVPLAGSRLTTALTLLLIRVDETVSVDALAEAMWGRVPSRSTSTLESHVWRLRNLLEPGRPRGAPSSTLLRHVDGYRLLVAPEQVDSIRFRQLADQIHHLLAEGQAERALLRSDEAMALWRGRPFSAVADEVWAQPAVARLEELHSQVRERQVEALLAVGRPERALVELESAIADQPLRERLWGHRMVAYARSGRTGDALAAYQNVRRLMFDEIGVEPGAELQELHRRILAEDPSLAAPRSQAPSVPRPTPEQLPRDVAGQVPVREGRLIGRTAECRAIGALLGERAVVTVVGTAGCGKTSVAAAVARDAARAFPDGVWTVDLAAVEADGQVGPLVASVFGVPAPGVGSILTTLREFTRGRRMLLLLDNCEHVLDAVAQLVDDLLVESAELTVLATSREPLVVEGEQVCVLTPLALPPPGAGAGAVSAPAVELFLQRVNAARSDARLEERELALAVDICRAVDGVPLALELAAARARAYSLDEIAAQVATDPSALARIGRRAAGHHTTVRFAVQQSYRMLSDAEAALHRAVSVVPGPFTAALAAVLTGRAEDETLALLAQLVHRSMLVPLGPAEPGRPSRFTQLATVRGHAANAAADERAELVERRDRWVAELVVARPRLGTADEIGWIAAVDDALAALRATLQHRLVESPSGLGARVASRLGLYWYYRGMMIEARYAQERATTVPAAAPEDAGMVRLMLGGSLAMANRWDLGGPLIEEGRDVVRGTAAATSSDYCDTLGVLSGALFTAGQDAVGRSVAAEIVGIAEATGDEHTRLVADLAALLSTAGTAAANVVAERATAVYDRAARADNTFVSWMASQAGTDAALAGGDPDEGMRWSDRMVAQHRTLRVGEGPMLLEARANLSAMAGEADTAVRLYVAARAHYQRAGMRWPQRALTTDLMHRAVQALDRFELEAAQEAGARLTLDDLTAPPPRP